MLTSSLESLYLSMKFQCFLFAKVFSTDCNDKVIFDPRYKMFTYMFSHVLQEKTNFYQSCWQILDFFAEKVARFTSQQVMLFSIVPHFGNTWFLLCLEQLDADWLNSCVCLEALHSDCFYCMWYLLCLEILHSDCFCCMHSHWMSALLLQQVAGFFVAPAF